MICKKILFVNLQPCNLFLRDNTAAASCEKVSLAAKKFLAIERAWNTEKAKSVSCECIFVNVLITYTDVHNFFSYGHMQIIFVHIDIIVYFADILNINLIFVFLLHSNYNYCKYCIDIFYGKKITCRRCNTKFVIIKPLWVSYTPYDEM